MTRPPPRETPLSGSSSPPPLPSRKPATPSPTPAPPRRSPLPPQPSTATGPLPPPTPVRRLPPALAGQAETAGDKDGMVREGQMGEEQLHVLLRRFDKQVLHVQTVPPNETRISSTPPLLDLQPAPHEAFSPEKLRSNAERLYATVLVGLLRLRRHVVRLRSWDEGGRTGAFLAAYIAAWSAHLVCASIFSLVSILVLFPSTRAVCFPPAPAGPAALPQQPRAADLDPGAEAVEHDATVFLDRLEGLASTGLRRPAPGAEESAAINLDEYELSTAVNEPEDDPDDGPDDAARKQQARKCEKERKKNERDEAVRLIGTPVMQVIGNLADGWERWANALSPTPPFSSPSGRVSIFLYLLLPIILSTTILSDKVFSSAISALIGFLFFGGPAIDLLVACLNETYPGWQERLELRNGILAGCPTDAQLALRLLRDAEARLSPLPPAPPPPVRDPPSSDEDSIADSHVSLMGGTPSEGEGATAPEKARKGQGFGLKFAGAVRSAAKFTEKSAALLGGHEQVDWNAAALAVLARINAPVSVRSSRAARTLLGFIPAKDEREGGPSSYFVYHAGRPGHLLIHPFNRKTLDRPFITFTTLEDPSSSSAPSVSGGAPAGRPRPPRAKRIRADIPVDAIAALRKTGLGGWQGRLLVALAAGPAALTGVGGAGLEITVRRSAAGAGAQAAGLEGEGAVVREGKDEEVKYRFGGIVRRDELFNRLVALGGQRWECL